MLVPTEALRRELKEVIGKVKGRGVVRSTDFAKDLVVDLLATRFEVSSNVIERRLNYEEIDFAFLW